MWQESIWFYILPFTTALLIVQPLVWLVRKFAFRYQILDLPDRGRKLHQRPVPLLGGVALGIGFIFCIGLFIKFGFLLDGRLNLKHLVVLIIASFCLILGGILDDKFHLSPTKQFIWPLFAVLIILFGGIQVNFITNPLGGILQLDAGQVNLGNLVFSPLSLLLSFIWLIGMIYTTKFLDGLDGLVSGMTFLGAIFIFFVSLAWDIPYSGTSVLALLVAGLMFGFLLWNFFPAKIFLGESGSTLAGLWLGVLAIISGGKIATALLVMGLPILDVAWVITRRIFWEKTSPTTADRKHLHFRLLDSGFSHRQAVLFLYLLATLFGSVALFQNSKGKLILFLILLAVMAIIGSILVLAYKKKYDKK
jgi:UDP-GlcNAc:undecaprenyl-phosphate GlcNAc-1-phosphate transferase